MLFIITKISRSQLAKLFLVFAGLSFVGTFYFTQHFLNVKEIISQQEKDNALQTAQQAAKEIDTLITKLRPLVSQLANDLSKGTISQNQLIAQLEKKPVDITGFGVAFEPQNNRLSGYYYVEKDDKQQLLKLQDYFKVNDPRSTWYYKALEKTQLMGPFINPTTGQKIVMYAQSFFLPGKQTPGVIFATQSIDHINHLLSTIYLGQKGYWFIFDHEGTMLSHPDTVFVDENILEIIPNLAPFKLLEKKAKKNPFYFYQNEMTGSNSWLFTEQIPSVNWTLAGVFDTAEIPLKNQFSRRLLIWVILTTILSLIFLVAFLVLDKTAPNFRQLWIGSTTISVLLMAAIGSIWYISDQYPSYASTISAIESKAALYQFLDSYNQGNQKGKDFEQPIKTKKIDDLDHLLLYRYKHGGFVPTGLIINEIEFASNAQIEIVGLVWQRYFDRIHEGVSRGFIFPQLADNPSINELSRIREKNVETIIWQVRAKLNLDMSFKKYPFDFKDLSIQLWHKDFDKNIILVPDLDSYSILTPSSLPGLSKTARISGWDFSGSYFGYGFVHYDTTFGLYSYGPFGIYKQISKSNVPEFYFDIKAKRNLVDTSLTDLITILVIMLLLFITFLTMKTLQFKNVLTGLAAVMFSTLLAQIRFRNSIPATGLVYFEGFYFIIYFAILAVLVIALLDLYKADITLIQYKDAIIAKILYWPILLTSTLSLTLIYLY